MNIINIVRIAKVVALAAFILPWAAVSCQGVDVATASGLDLAMGKLQANPDAQRQMEGGLRNAFGGAFEAPAEPAAVEPAEARSEDIGVNYFAIAAAVVIVAGLLLTFVGGAKTAGRNALVTGLVGAALVFGSVWSFKQSIASEAQREDSGGAQDSPFGGGQMGGGAMAQQMLDSMVQERIGYWLALGGLLVAAAAGGLAMSQGAGAAKPRDDQPAA